MGEAANQQLLQRLRDYRMPRPAIALLNKHKPLILAGITGSGKTSIVNHIEQSSRWRHVITHTTRVIRPDEEPGKNYQFMSEQEMLKLVDSGAFIEVNAVHGSAVYGTSIEAYAKVIADGFSPMLIIDVQGIQDITKYIPGLRAKFLLPPSFEVWFERLDMRGVMRATEKQKRFRSAKTEVEQALADPHFGLVVNNDLAVAASEVIAERVDPAAQKNNQEIARQLLEHIQAS